MPKIATRITFDDLPVYNPRHLYDQVIELGNNGKTGINTGLFWQRCNSFTFSRGFEPGRGYLLMSGADVNTLRATTSLNSGSHVLTFSGEQDMTILDLHITEMTCVTGGASFKGDSIYVVSVADKRILGPLTSVNKSYNVYASTTSATGTADTYDRYPFSQNSGTNWTWQGIIDNLWSLMPSASFGSLDSSAASFTDLGTPYNYAFHGISAWSALEKILNDTYHHLLLSRDGTFSIEPAFVATDDLANSIAASAKYLLRSSNDFEAISPKVPATIRVFFPARNRAWQGSTHTIVLHPNDNFRELPLYSIDKTTGVTGAVAGTILPIHNSTPALYNDSGTLSNSSALDTIATKIKDNYIATAQRSELTGFRVYSAAQDFSPGLETHTVCYSDFGDGMTTNVCNTYDARSSSPLLDMHRKGGGGLANDDITPFAQAFSSKEGNGPPDLSRYSELTARFVWVQLQAALTANGVATASIQKGSRGASAVTLADSSTLREIQLYEIGGQSYPTDTFLLAYYDYQVSRWIAVPTSGVLFHRGITDAAITKGATGTVSRYNPGTTTDSTTNDQVVNEIADIAISKKIYYIKSGANYYAITGECPLT